MRNGTAFFLIMILTGLTAAMGQEAMDKPGAKAPGVAMRIGLTNVFVEDQAKAEQFYTGVLGFVKKDDFPVGEFRWLTVASPEEPGGTQLLLEPNDNPAARAFQKAIFDQGIPAATFFVKDVRETSEKLKAQGVRFTMQPTDVGTAIIAIFDDTCGNLIQIAQKTSPASP